jgi:hypothetical protein
MPVFAWGLPNRMIGSLSLVSAGSEIEESLEFFFFSPGHTTQAIQERLI